MKISQVILYPFALLYGAGVALRNLLYRVNFYQSIPFEVPIISVGNLSVGGTGKTPHIEYLVRTLQDDYNIATLSRGYRRRTSGFRLAGENDTACTIGDEPMQYHRKFPGVKVAVAENRVLAVPDILAHHPETDVILLDDAFQHRAIEPGLQILLTTYHRPFFADHLLPAGQLREWPSGKARAHMIIVTKCPPGMTREEQEGFIASIQPLPHQKVFFTTLQYGQPKNLLTGETRGLGDVGSVLMVTGIANNQPMAQQLEKEVKHVTALSFPDHHYFTQRELDKILAKYDRLAGPKIILTTEKDAMRLMEHKGWLQKNPPVYYWPIEVAFLKDKTVFDGQVLEFIESFTTH